MAVFNVAQAKLPQFMINTQISGAAASGKDGLFATILASLCHLVQHLTRSVVGQNVGARMIPHSPNPGVGVAGGCARVLPPPREHPRLTGRAHRYAPVGMSSASVAIMCVTRSTGLPCEHRHGLNPGVGVTVGGTGVSVTCGVSFAPGNG